VMYQRIHRALRYQEAQLEETRKVLLAHQKESGEIAQQTSIELTKEVEKLQAKKDLVKNIESGAYDLNLEELKEKKPEEALLHIYQNRKEIEQAMEKTKEFLSDEDLKK